MNNLCVNSDERNAVSSLYSCCWFVSCSTAPHLQLPSGNSRWGKICYVFLNLLTCLVSSLGDCKWTQGADFTEKSTTIFDKDVTLSLGKCSNAQLKCHITIFKWQPISSTCIKITFLIFVKPTQTWSTFCILEKPVPRFGEWNSVLFFNITSSNWIHLL